MRSSAAAIHRNPANGSLWLTNAGIRRDAVDEQRCCWRTRVWTSICTMPLTMEGFGKLIFNLQGTDTISNVTQPQTSVPDPTSGCVGARADEYNCAGFEGVTCTNPLPHWRHVFSTDWATPWQGLDLHAQWRFIGPTQVDALNQSPLLSSPSTIFNSGLRSHPELQLPRPVCIGGDQFKRFCSASAPTTCWTRTRRSFCPQIAR